MNNPDPHRYRTSAWLHQAWRLERISPAFANEVYDRIAELEDKARTDAEGIAELQQIVASYTTELRELAEAVDAWVKAEEHWNNACDARDPDEADAASDDKARAYLAMIQLAADILSEQEANDAM